MSYSEYELPHMMINMKGEEIPLVKKSVVRSWERKYKDASFEITGENVYHHKVLKSGEMQLWWVLEIDSPFTSDLRRDLDLMSEKYVPHITLQTKRSSPIG